MTMTATDETFRIRSARLFLLVAAGLLLLLSDGALSAVEVSRDAEFTDAEIVQALDWDLVMDDAVNSRMIDVRAEDGVVTLSGSVDHLLAKEWAVKLAQRLKGVRAVVDLMELTPVLRTDEEIKTEIEEALIDDSATESFEIGVSVHAGIVTLTGTVESWQEKMLSEAVAKGVRGVREIFNEVEVRYPKERPDPEIRADIEARLENDIWVEAPLVTVAVENGSVRLSGTVASVAERRQAIADAWVAGVKAVYHDGLEVNPQLKLSGIRDGAPAWRTDAEIEGAVTAALFQDPRVRSFGIEVDVSNGIVTLSGDVSNLAAKRSATGDAKNTLGVQRVKNTIKVRPDDPPSDEELTRKIQRALDRNPYLEFYEIFTSVTNGAVYLYGEVDSVFELRLAGSVAERMSGVTDVINLIHVEPSWLTRSDWEIEEDVENKLRWNAYVDHEGIEVDVQDAVATLDGTIDTMSGKIAAGRSALAAGAKSVRNNLVVRSQPERY